MKRVAGAWLATVGRVKWQESERQSSRRDPALARIVAAMEPRHLRRKVPPAVNQPQGLNSARVRSYYRNMFGDVQAPRQTVTRPSSAQRSICEAIAHGRTKTQLRDL